MFDFGFSGSDIQYFWKSGKKSVALGSVIIVDDHFTYCKTSFPLKEQRKYCLDFRNQGKNMIHSIQVNIFEYYRFMNTKKYQDVCLSVCQKPISPGWTEKT